MEAKHSKAHVLLLTSVDCVASHTACRIASLSAFIEKIVSVKQRELLRAFTAA